MSKIIPIPKVPQPLLDFWSKKYGKTETIILGKLVPEMAQQFSSEYKKKEKEEKFSYALMIDYEDGKIKSEFPELKKNLLKKTLDSLKKKGVIKLIGNIETFLVLIFVEHELLVREMISFEESFYV